MKVLVALDREAQSAPKRGQLAQADIAKLRVAETEIAQAEGKVLVVRGDLSQQPRGVRIRGEKLDHRARVDLFPASGAMTVGEELSKGSFV